MSWFSKNKKDSDLPTLPELPRSSNISVNEDDFHDDISYLPEIQKEEGHYKPKNMDWNNFNEEDLNKKSNFTKELNEKENFITPVYDSISNMDKSRFTKDNFEENITRPKPLRNFEEDNINSNKLKRPSINTPSIKSIKNSNNSKENMQVSNSQRSFTKDTEPVYVRLDKFQATIESFEDIKSKINQIESLLNKTKEIRAKEDKELEEWEQEIGVIKTKLDNIDKNIFEKLG